MASISSEAWPSMKSTLSLPWRQLRGSAVNVKPVPKSDVREYVSTTAPRAPNKVSAGYQPREINANSTRPL